MFPLRRYLTQTAPRAALPLVLGLLALPAQAADGDKSVRIDRALLKQAPAIIKYLQGKGYKNVGVLKFQVKKGDGPATDSAGPINLAVANQLELALLVANDNDVQKQLGIIARASGVAARVKGGSHLTAEGRQKLLAARYPLAWGKDDVVPDALLTGLVEVSPDLRTLTVTVLAFDKESTLQKVVVFQATNDSRTLMDSGESFLLRGAFDRGEPQVREQKAIATAAGVKTTALKYPLQDAAAPVTLDILYDGKTVPVTFRDGQAWVQEPQEGQKVELVIRRLDRGAGRFAAVVFVNGENTLYKQRLPVAQCTKWVLGPNAEPIQLLGFKTGADKGEAFRVLCRAESKLNEVYYGADVGTIALVVFREKVTRDEEKLLTEDEEDLAAVHRGILPTERPRNLGALKQQLHADASRDLIGAGEEIKIETVKVNFEPDLTPVMSVTIRYYRP